MLSWTWKVLFNTAWTRLLILGAFGVHQAQICVKEHAASVIGCLKTCTGVLDRIGFFIESAALDTKATTFAPRH